MLHFGKIPKKFGENLARFRKQFSKSVANFTKFVRSLLNFAKFLPIFSGFSQNAGFFENFRKMLKNRNLDSLVLRDEQILGQESGKRGQNLGQKLGKGRQKFGQHFGHRQFYNKETRFAENMSEMLSEISPSFAQIMSEIVFEILQRFAENLFITSSRSGSSSKRF